MFKIYSEKVQQPYIFCYMKLFLFTRSSGGSEHACGGVRLWPTHPGAPRRRTSQRAAAGRAELRALTLGGAVWDAFRENANCGDPVG